VLDKHHSQKALLAGHASALHAGEEVLLLLGVVAALGGHVLGLA
jgi:hypothetical protein